jgi:chromosome segregation ATPase
MPEITAYKGIFRDWEGVSGACAKNAALLPKSEAIRPELDAILVQLKDFKIEQENLTGNRQALTQRIRQLVTEGREVARKLRNQIKVELGDKSEHLPQFGIAPIRKQVRRAQTAATKPAATIPITTNDLAPKPAA